VAARIAGGCGAGGDALMNLYLLDTVARIRGNFRTALSSHASSPSVKWLV